VPNDFTPDLQYSLEERDNDLFDNFYRRIFPGISGIEFCNDLKTQKTGIDKIIHFSRGNKFTIDEKKRRKDHGDIALELWSIGHEDENKNYIGEKRGWLYYSVCDYIVYAVMPSLKVYLLPTILLKRAWYIYQTDWTQKAKFKADSFKYAIAKNKGYDTQSICIPTGVLLDAISKEMSQKLLNTS
jgi:hypothetical protein